LSRLVCLSSPLAHSLGRRARHGLLHSLALRACLSLCLLSPCLRFFLSVHRSHACSSPSLLALSLSPSVFAAFSTRSCASCLLLVCMHLSLLSLLFLCDRSLMWWLLFCVALFLSLPLCLSLSLHHALSSSSSLLTHSDGIYVSAPLFSSATRVEPRSGRNGSPSLPIRVCVSCVSTSVARVA
jgi:hypothetical protein